MPIPHSCLTCGKTFTTYNAVKSHARAKGHVTNCAVCKECDLAFISIEALQAHLRSSPRHRGFQDGHDDSDSEGDVAWSSDDGYDDYSEDDVNDSEDDVEDTYCAGCNKEFVGQFALHQHLVDSPKHNWCFECSRDFQSEGALHNHQNSLAHKDRDFKCPFCAAMFKSPSGIGMHLESGCHKLTRHHVTAAVHAMKIVPNLSIKRITGPVAPPTNLKTYIATEASWNGKAYTCFLCNRKTFKTLQALNGHLNSPAHDDDEFRCPKCKKEFKLISSFVQHLESRACGLAKNGQVDNYFNDLSGQFSRMLKM